ncbi:YIP1 family protein [Sagittula sp. SSi028]|uniref:YIP1 family protein n=1 Tax=Sagittula sp. SSi028 TaxID=3400636 RepID=UPI003AF987FF
MTLTQGLVRMALETITGPRRVAQQLMAAHLSREVLATAFALVITLNAVLYGLTLLLAPPPAGTSIFLAQPVGYAVVEVVSLAGMIASLTFVGRLMGGAGRFEDVALLLIWLQALNAAVQAASLILLVAIPPLSGLMSLVAMVIGFWILLNFIAEAHGYGTLLKAFGVFILALLALGFALSMLMTLAGVSPEGLIGNV